MSERDELAQLAAQLGRHAAHAQRRGVHAVPRVEPAPVAAAAAGAVAAPVPAPAPAPTVVAAPALAVAAAPAPPADASLLKVIRGDLGDCTRCKLASTRKNIVFGVGNPAAHLVFVGEAPGANEDAQGEPFVGEAGQLLTKMIGAMGYARDDVYIANILKCRPPGNRNPEPDEIAQCEPFLKRQLAAIKPRMIVALGKFAAQCLLGRFDTPISALRGRFHEYEGIRLMPTYHPAYLLRTPTAKRMVWDDLQLVMAELARLGLSPPSPPWS